MDKYDRKLIDEVIEKEHLDMISKIMFGEEPVISFQYDRNGDLYMLSSVSNTMHLSENFTGSDMLRKKASIAKNALRLLEDMRAVLGRSIATARYHMNSQGWYQAGQVVGHAEKLLERLTRIAEATDCMTNWSTPVHVPGNGGVYMFFFKDEDAYSHMEVSASELETMDDIDIRCVLQGRVNEDAKRRKDKQ